MQKEVTVLTQWSQNHLFQPLSHSIWLICVLFCVFGLSSTWKSASLGELIWLGEYFSYLLYKMQKCTRICNNMHHVLALNMYCILALKTTNIFQLPSQKNKSSMQPLQWVLSHDSLSQVMKTFPVSWRINKPEHFCTSSIPQEIKYCFCFPNTLEKASLLISTAKTAHERNAVHFLTKI